MTELKCCPFCGCEEIEGVVGLNTHTGRRFFKIYCAKCQVRTENKQTRRQAVIAWNRRHVPEAES